MAKQTKKAADNSAGDDQPLEKEIARLEEIVSKLESGQTTLEQSIDLYSEGHRIGQRALKRLEGLERRIEIVAREATDGALETVDFPEDDDDDQDDEL